jgi:hypothetical protein
VEGRVVRRRNADGVPVGEARPLLLSRIDERAWWGKPIRWTSFSVKKRLPCDDCVLLLHEVKGGAPPPRQAVMRRRSGGDKETVLCQAHAQNWQDAQKRKERT